MALRGVAPVLLVADVAATMRWFAAKLGFVGHAFPPAPPHAFAVLEHGGVEIMLQGLAGTPPVDTYHLRDGGVWHVYLRVEGVHELAARLGADPEVTVLEPLTRQPYGDTELVVRNPDGHVIVLSELVPPLGA